MRGKNAGFTLTLDSLKHVIRTVKTVNRMTREHYNETPTGTVGAAAAHQTVVWFAEVTGTPPGGADDLSSLWPGKFYLPDTTDLSMWSETKCWLRALPGQEYMVGQTGTARLVGFRSGDTGFLVNPNPDVYPFPPRPIYTFEAGDNPNERYAQEEVNSHPAFQTYLTTVPGADPETSETYVTQFQEEGDFAGPTFAIQLYPEGTNNPETFTYQLDHDADNNLVSETYVYQLDESEVTRTLTPNSETYVYQMPYNDAALTYTYQLGELLDTYVIRSLTPTLFQEEIAITDDTFVIRSQTPTQYQEEYDIGGAVGTITFTESAGVIVATGVNVTLAGSLAGGGGNGPEWVRILVNFSDFTAAANNQTITLHGLPARGVIHGAILKPIVLFDHPGLGFTTYDLSVGITGSTGRYILPYDVAEGSAVLNDTTFASNFTSNLPEARDFGSTVNITVTADIDGSLDLADATAGQAEVLLLISTLPSS